MPSADKKNARRKVLVSTVKNEGLYLLEWLAYHKSIGVDDFCIFSNDCSDGTNLMLNRLNQMGVIRHFDWLVRMATVTARDAAWVIGEKASALRP